MGASNSRVNQSIINNSSLISIPTTIYQISSSICKIFAGGGIGTGFLIKFFKGEEDFFCLMTNEHIITKELIKNKSKISFTYDNEKKLKEIILDNKERYIRDFRDYQIDCSIVEIISRDNINKDLFLLPNIYYMYNLSELLDELIQIPQFPKGGNLCFSEGKISGINNHELTHLSSTAKGSSGSPLFLKDTTKVIGIHKQGGKNENYADSIGLIFNFIKNGFKYKKINPILIDAKDIENILTSLSHSSNFDYKLFNSIKVHNENFFEEDNSFSFKNKIYFNNDIPVVFRVHSDKGLIQFNSKNDEMDMDIKEYFNNLAKIEIQKCSKCENDISEQNLKFCGKCHSYICLSCIKYFHMEHYDSCISISNMINNCIIHLKEITIYCMDCQKNICKICYEDFHKSHEIGEIDKSKAKNARNTIKKQIEKLLNMITFYEKINYLYELNPINKINQKNLKNVAESIKKEKHRDIYDMDLALYKLNQKEIGRSNNDFKSQICDKIHENISVPEVLDTFCGAGKIILKCHNCINAKKKEVNVEEYFEILKSKKASISESFGTFEPINNSEDGISNYRTVIKDKIEELLYIIKFYVFMLREQEKFPYIYYYYQSLINLEEFIKEENKISFGLDYILENSKKYKKFEMDEIFEKLRRDYEINLKDFYMKKNFQLKLKGEKMPHKLGDIGFKLVSNIIYKNIIEINLSYHKIRDICYLNNMFLPHLEVINLSYNEIIDITPVANLLSKYLKEIYLQNNEINDLVPFMNSKFPDLEILRVDNNIKAFNKKSFKDLINKYKKIIFYETINNGDFENKYDEIFDFSSYKLELGSRRCGDIILIDMYGLIEYPNRLEYLCLDDNRLTDVSILNKMPLYQLRLLDLSLNFITNIKFVKKMSERFTRLETLYLNCNKISDISLLIKNNDIIFPNLKVLTLRSNKLDIKDGNTYLILNLLIRKHESGNDFDIDYESKDLCIY